MKLILTIILLACFISCATNPDKIGATYVSPLKYRNYDEDQIILEMDYVGQRTSELYQRLKKKATGDKWQTGIGLVLFWPALFALEGGDGPEATEYARLKGEYEALRQTAIQKKITMNRLPPSPTEVVEDLKRKDKDK
jgi:hypothetical protein